MDNPNPMNSRCGLADCDCEYTIGGLLRRLELVAKQCTAGLHPAVDKNAVFRAISWHVKRTVAQTRGACNEGVIELSDCACYQDGYQAGCEAERWPPGA